ncbi:MAG: glutamine-hydrolyzing carbamoyl-phosphate synthase small subunit [Candidatus Bathyarchaeota archaeon]|nr:MAG: glutamine-hydrolyzing carbamoyl-phosphate synthase small subunit [Candidatus Bathyarchaeota archaeon]
MMRGTGFGASVKTYGEVVFNTGMVGYPEAITDPSYKGQILIQTYPLIGNYGVSARSFESDGPKIRGYIIHELCKTPSHWSSELTLNSWLERSNIPGIEGIDTRLLTKKIRARGTMLGILEVTEDDLKDKHLQNLRKEVKHLVHPDTEKLAYSVATTSIRTYNVDSNRSVVLIDCGVKSSIIANLKQRGLNVIVVPPTTSSREILEFHPVAVVLSNGPGNPQLYTEVIDTTKELIEAELPILGICLGCQIVGLSLGADTYKLKFGHRGQNHPCMEVKTKKCYITSQNHGYVLREDTLDKAGFEKTLINVNDKTVEGIEHKRFLIKGYQFHPEASPGPMDSNFFFDQFFTFIK